MKLLALICQHCSAPLQVPENAQYVTCTHCGSQLAVKNAHGAAYTEMLEAIDQRTEEMAEQLDVLQRKTALAELDRQWESQREAYYITDKDGERSLPSTSGSIAGGVIVSVFGALWVAVACGIGGAIDQVAGGPIGMIGSVFPLFGLAFVALGLWTAFHGYQKAQDYEQAHANYLHERARLLSGQRESEG